MKIQKLVAIGILLLGSVVALSAQNPLPDPHDDACWQSLSALRACELEQYDRAMDQAERCSSYPEYQCMPATEQGASGETIAKGKSKTSNSKTSAQEKAAPVPDTSAQSWSVQLIDWK